VREALKTVIHYAGLLAVAPSVVSFRLRSLVIGPDRALEASSQFWSNVPGLSGQYLRRAFLTQSLSFCARTATIEFGTVFSSASASIGERAYIGPRCHIGWAIIEADVLLAAGVHVPSGARTHGMDDLSMPMRDQPSSKSPVRIGAGAWIGSAAVVMADVGKNAVIGAGAVVTKPIADLAVAGGVPARVLRTRGPGSDQRPA
jgi:virginiamycin A acetyltransferase